ncbi:VanZ family protein [Flavobacterium urocaniciphilum]|uniref:VanZ family protein n=1 Tax=Flavobacterium urocaniciphilum TaxID=1299341 RepID=UPI00115FD938
MKIIQHLSEHKLFKVLAVIWTITILYLCLSDSPNVPNFKLPFKDKIVHFSFYFMFVFLWVKSFENKTFKKGLIVLFLAILLGISIEFLQENFTVHRTYDNYDILANTLGGLFSFLLVIKFHLIKN